MDDFKKRCTEAIEWLGNEYASIRTGQATPALLDSIKVDSYGTKVPLNQVSSISVEDARTLRISPWGTDSISSIEGALTDADLGLSVVTDSSGLRVLFPELTSERRVQLLKAAKSKLEDARVSVRAARDEIMRTIDKQQKEGDISEDDRFTMKEKIQKHVDDTNRSLDELYEKKEREINK